ncbi:hypothetical protein DAETH_47910 (plasmid) [Deinococcus aetherius]|uniref:Uncharacterized protein n=1 Tax=Deinococcus aetherius TaxID=200252 RepID=A0ABN6RNE8_9DEIO|nr:hypothetical protein [Deinococcus aetherius]BDP44822.1 hypothetical protein DAETH_47910 [Deinococcus aetherius]
MLASEFAHELGVDPSVISKRLAVYHAEAGTPKRRVLDEQTLTHLREAHELVTGGQADTFKAAVQMVLGTYVSEVPAGTARELLERLSRIEERQLVVEVQMSRVADALDRLVNRVNG